MLLEIFTDEGVGTQVLPGVPTKIRKAYTTAEDECMSNAAIQRALRRRR